MGTRLTALAVGTVLLAAGPASANEPAQASSRLCANTYGGDVISATNNLRCAKARAIVRAWAVRYRRDGRVNRTVLGYRCRDRSSSVEGLTLKCRRGRKVVRFYANVPA